VTKAAFKKIDSVGSVAREDLRYRIVMFGLMTTVVAFL